MFLCLLCLSGTRLGATGAFGSFGANPATAPGAPAFWVSRCTRRAVMGAPSPPSGVFPSRGTGITRIWRPVRPPRRARPGKRLCGRGRQTKAPLHHRGLRNDPALQGRGRPCARDRASTGRHVPVHDLAGAGGREASAQSEILALRGRQVRLGAPRDGRDEKTSLVFWRGEESARLAPSRVQF